MDILSKLTPEQITSLDKEKLELILNHDKQYIAAAKIKAFFYRIIRDENDKSKMSINDLETYKEFIESMSLIKNMKFYITLEEGEYTYRLHGERAKYCIPKNIYTMDEILKIIHHPNELLTKNVNYSISIYGGTKTETMNACEIRERFPNILNYIDPIKLIVYEGFLKAGIIKD